MMTIGIGCSIVKGTLQSKRKWQKYALLRVFSCSATFAREKTSATYSKAPPYIKHQLLPVIDFTMAFQLPQRKNTSSGFPTVTRSGSCSVVATATSV